MSVHPSRRGTDGHITLMMEVVSTSETWDYMVQHPRRQSSSSLGKKLFFEGSFLLQRTVNSNVYFLVHILGKV
jgi:hypothetical protein